jgi:hypothetical protein
MNRQRKEWTGSEDEALQEFAKGSHVLSPLGVSFWNLAEKQKVRKKKIFKREHSLPWWFRF